MSLPPVPARVLTPYEKRKRQERWLSLKQAAESGKLTSMDPMEALQQALRQGTATPELVKEVAQTPKPSFMDRFLKALNAVGLPFEAFSEGVNALVGPLIPQQAFQERSTRSRAVLKAMFGGKVSPAEAAGALREITRERSMAEQLITGTIFNPFVFIGPVGAGAKAGLTVGAKAGLAAGVKAAAQAAPRGAVVNLPPILGGKLATRLGLKTTEQIILEAADRLGKVDRAAHLDMLYKTGRMTVAGGSDVPVPKGESPLLPRGTPEQVAELYRANSIFYDALNDPASYAGVRGIENLLKMDAVAAQNPARHALFRLLVDTFGRGFEGINLRPSDLQADGTLLFRSVRRKAGEIRFPVQPTQRTVEMLKAAMQGVGADKPIFTARTLGVKRLSGLSLVDSFMETLAREAGITLKPGESVRPMMASFYADLARQGDAPASIASLQVLLGHSAPGLHNLYAARSGELQVDALTRQFMDAQESFKPLPSAETQAAKAVGKVVKAEAEAAAGAPGIPLRYKGKSLAGAKKEGLRVEQGKAKLDNLELSDPDYWAPKLASITSDQDHDILLAGIRVIEGSAMLRKLRSVEEYADLMRNQAPKASSVYKSKTAFLRGVREELNTLALGLQSRFANVVAPRRSQIAKVLSKLVDDGLLTDEGKQLMLMGLDKAELEFKYILKPGRMFGPSQKVSAKLLDNLGLNYLGAATTSLRLTRLDQGSGAAQIAAVGEWLDNPKIQQVLSRMGFVLDDVELDGQKIKVIQSDVRSLVDRLYRMVRPGATTRHLLGDDMYKAVSAGGPEEAARFARAEAVANALLMGRRVDLHEHAAKRLVDAVTGAGPDLEAEEIFSALPPTPKRSTTIAFDDDWLPKNPANELEAKGYITPRFSVSVADRQDIRPSPGFAKFVEGFERMVIEGESAAVRKFGSLAENVLKIIPLQGATARGVARRIWATRSVYQRIEYSANIAKSRLQQHAGYKSLLKRLLDPRDPRQGFSPNRLAVLPGAINTRIYQVAKKVGSQEYVGFDVNDFLRHPLTLFKLAALDELPKILDLTADEIAYISTLRNMAREGTKALIKDVGPKRAIVALGRKPSLDYFPTMASETSTKTLGIKSISQYGFLQPGDWSKDIQIRDALDAWKQGIKYHDPLDAVLSYVAGTQKYGADFELYNLLKEQGVFEEGGKRILTREHAARTLVTLARELKNTGQTALAPERLAQLAGYSDEVMFKDELTNQLGRLADDLFKYPDRAAEFLPDIEAEATLATESIQRARKLHDLTKGLPGLGRAWFGESLDANRAVRFFQEQEKGLNQFLKSTNQLSSALRMAQAGMDVSFHAIQGLVALASHPIIWVKAARDSMRILVHPEMMAQMTAKHADSIREFVSYAGVWESPEIFEAARPVQAVMDRIPVIGGFKLPQRFEAAFTGYLLNMRYYLWESLKPLAHGEYEHLQELANHVNKFTGVFNPATAGYSKFQRYMEGTFLSFAPMYRRAALGLIVDAFRGVPGKTKRLDVQQAQKSLTMLAGAAISYGAMLEATGLNPDALDPNTPKFMSFKVPGTDYWLGIGSAYYGIVRAAWAVTEQAMNPDEREKLAYVNFRDNSLLRWWRSQAPPLMQAGIDGILSQTYTGEPLRGEDGALTPAAMAYWGVQQVMPMSLQTLMSDWRNPDALGAVLGESFGARTFPVSLRDKRRTLADNLVQVEAEPEIVAWRTEQERTGQYASFERLPTLLKQRLTSRSIELQVLDQEIEKDTLRRGRDELKDRTLYFQQARKNKTYINDGLKKLADSLAAGQISGRDFRDGVRRWQTASVALSTRLADQYPDVIGYLNQRKLERADDTDSFYGDILYDSYHSNVILNPLVYDQQGNFLPRVRERLELGFKKQYGIIAWDYIQRRRRESKQYPDLVQEYFYASEDLKPYWRLHHDIWGAGSDQAELIDDYQNLTPREQEQARDESARLRRLLRLLDRAKEKFRSKNPELDWLLVKWHDYPPRTRLAESRLHDWQARQALL